ncbi:MAG TPA: 6-bladed beta-propeller [Acidobacteriota bacterium]
MTYVENPATGLWDGRDPLPVSFELEQVFGVEEGPDEMMLGSVRGVAVDDEQNVYVFDQQSNRLVSFAGDGSVRWTAGRQGQGPEEFQRARGIAWDGEGSLFIANQGGTRLDQWDLDGAFLATYPLGTARVSGGQLAGFLRSDTAVFTEFTPGAVGVDFTVVELGEPLTARAEASVRVNPDLAIPATVGAGVDLRVADGAILVGNDGEYVLRGYDADAQLTRVVSRPVDYLVRVGVHFIDKRRGSIGSFGQLMAPLALESGHWLVSAYWPTNIDDPDAEIRRMMETRERTTTEYANSLDLFDPDGRFLGSVLQEGTNAPDIGRPELVGPDGRLYTTLYNPFPQVRRYRVRIEG